MNHMSQKLNPYDLTETQMMIFQVLKKRPEGLSCRELSREVHSTPESVKVLIWRMRRKGVPIPSLRVNGGRGKRRGKDGEELEKYVLIAEREVS